MTDANGRTLLVTPPKCAPGALCASCRYDLAGLSVDGLCPECGIAILESFEASRLALHLTCASCNSTLFEPYVDGFCGKCSTPVRESLREPVTDSKPCVICAYELRGLPMNTRCPECGTPVEHSLHKNLLRNAKPEYLRKLRRGTEIIRISAWLQAIAMLGTALLVLFSFIGFDDDYEAVVLILMLVWFLVFVIMMLLCPLGWWFASSPDPGVTDPAITKARRRVRILILANVASVVMLPLTFLFTLCVEGAGMSYAKSLAERASDEPLAWYARLSLRLIRWTLALATASLVSGIVLLRDRSGFGGGIVGVITVATVILWMATVVVYALSCSALHATTRAAYAHARDRDQLTPDQPSGTGHG